MPTFRKIPVEVEAWQNSPSRDGAPAWVHEAIADDRIKISESNCVYIQNRIGENYSTGNPDYWIVKDEDGLLHPVAPDTFEATYEPVEKQP